MSEVQLRDVDESDFPALFEHQLDPEANAMAAFSARDWEDFAAHWTKSVADDSVVAKAILLDGQLVGHIVSFEYLGEREVGYWVGKEHWGKGVATRALVAFLRHEKRRPLHAGVAKHNAGSIRVLEKCGFAIVRETTWPSESPGEDDVDAVLLMLDES